MNLKCARCIFSFSIDSNYGHCCTCDDFSFCEECSKIKRTESINVNVDKDEGTKFCCFRYCRGPHKKCEMCDKENIQCCIKQGCIRCERCERDEEGSTASVSESESVSESDNEENK